MAITAVKKIKDNVEIKHALISVYNKNGLDEFVPELLKHCPGIKIFSTGGTFSHLQKIIGEKEHGRLIQVSDYTNQPETQGGLVKTLDFKIYLGLLTETFNDSHQAYLARTKSVPIDLVVVNLYPFQEVVSKPIVTFEEARGNIDIGGPCMIRAAAKNCLRVACVVNPSSYKGIIFELSQKDGTLSYATRHILMQQAFFHTAEYDQAIAIHMSGIHAIQAKSGYDC